MKLKKVTPKALKTLDELGLLDEKNAENLSYKIYLDTELLKKVCAVMFEDEVADFENLDLAEFTDGYRRFFWQLIPSSPESKS